MKALADSSVLTLTRALFSKLLGNLGDIRHMWRFEALNKVLMLLLLTALCRAALAEDVFGRGHVPTSQQSPRQRAGKPYTAWLLTLPSKAGSSV